MQLQTSNNSTAITTAERAKSLQALLQRYTNLTAEGSGSITALPATFTPAADAVRDFEKMRLAAFTAKELNIICDILLAEITIAIRSMGTAKDYTTAEIQLFTGQILDAFLVRGKTMSFASMLLFFKMRRNKQAPLNNVQFGVKPDAILDDLNTFCSWQMEQVVNDAFKNRKRNLTLAQRSANLGTCLKNAGKDAYEKFKEMQQRLQRLEKQKKEENKRAVNLEFQVKRLTNILYLELQNKEAAAERCSQLLKAWSPEDAADLKAMIDESFGSVQQQPAEEKKPFEFPVFDTDGNVIVKP